MKFYDEERMRGVRARFEGDVNDWPGVTSKEMMGCLCYFRGKRFFAFLVTDGIVLTRLADADRERAYARPGARPFEMAGKKASKWVQLPVRAPGDLKALLPLVRASYDGAGRPASPPR